jgi:outer membrane protein OmpA-like peptidoglycan-associated protein
MRYFVFLLLLPGLVFFTSCAKTSPNKLPAGIDASAIQAPSNAKMPTVQSFVFPCDSRVLPKSAIARLNQQAGYLITHRNTTILLASFTPAIGSVNLNIAQGQQRVRAVADYLALKGVAQNQMRTVSYGGAYDTRSGDNNASCVVVMRYRLATTKSI